MSWLWRLLLLVPITYLIMVVYVAPSHSDAAGVARAAVHKTAKVIGWVVVIVVVMELIEWVFLP